MKARTQTNIHTADTIIPKLSIWFKFKECKCWTRQSCKMNIKWKLQPHTIFILALVRFKTQSIKLFVYIPGQHHLEFLALMRHLKRGLHRK